MTAVWLRLRSELRGRWSSVLALGLIVGMVGGVVIAAVAAARRTDSAYDRFVVATGSPHAAVYARRASDLDTAMEQVRQLPQIADALVIRSPVAIPTRVDGEPVFEGGANVFWAPFEHPGSRWLRPKLVAGRLPDPDRVGEVAVGYNPTPQTQLGERFLLKIVRAGAVDPTGSQDFAPDDFFPPLHVEVVGVVLLVTSLEARTEGEVFVTPAFQRAYADGAMTGRNGLVRLRDGTEGVPAFAAAVERLAPGAQVVDFGGEADRVRRQTGPQATALWLFAGLAALVGVLIFGQALARHTLLESSENPTLRTLGMTPRQLVGVAVLRALVIGLLAVGAAIGVAFALSPLAPFGFAGLVEPHPGLSFDALTTGAGAFALGVVAILVSLPAAVRAARLRGDALGIVEISRARPSAVATGLARSRLSPSAAVGVRMALEPGRGRTAAPVRSTLMSVILALAGLTLAFGFGASLQHLLGTPRLTGADWDIALHAWESSTAAATWTPALRADPSVGEFSTGNFLDGRLVVGTSKARGVQTSAWGLNAAQGSVHPTVIEGRWPRSDAEIALGTTTLRSIEADVGDSVRVAANGRAFRLRVTGRVVFPEVSPGPPGVGNGAGLTLDGLRRLIPGLPARDVLIRLGPGTDIREVGGTFRNYRGISSLAAGTGLFTGLAELHHAEAVPVVLGGVLALAAILTLVHMLVSSIRRRRHDMAILVTLGFLRRQVSAAVAWQATTLAVLALAVGVPIGVIGGRWGWSLFADRVGVVPESVIPLVALSVAIPATLVLANLIAIVPGRIAARTRPAVVLRAE
jgi:hypothetical protein